MPMPWIKGFPWFRSLAWCMFFISMNASCTNKNPNNMNKKGTIGLTIAALATGAALGILLAPASGKKTRRRLVREGRKAKDKLNDLMKDGADAVSKLKDEVSNLAGKAKAEAEQGANATAEAARKAAASAKS